NPALDAQRLEEVPVVSGRRKVRDGGTKFKIGLLEFAAPLQIDTDVKMRFGRDDRCCKERETEDAIQITIIPSEEVPRPAVYKDFTGLHCSTGADLSSSQMQNAQFYIRLG